MCTLIIHVWNMIHYYMCHYNCLQCNLSLIFPKLHIFIQDLLPKVKKFLIISILSCHVVCVVVKICYLNSNSSAVLTNWSRNRYKSCFSHPKGSVNQWQVFQDWVPKTSLDLSNQDGLCSIVVQTRQKYSLVVCPQFTLHFVPVSTTICLFSLGVCIEVAETLSLQIKSFHFPLTVPINMCKEIEWDEVCFLNMFIVY